MSNGIQDSRSLPLSDIIGAPVGAIVQAEAQAARTTLDYIEQVGFEKDPNAPAGTSAFDMGRLRMVEFSYQKPDASGQPADFLVRVPLLALLPIPGVRVKSANIAFTAKITDVYSESTDTTQTGSADPAIAKADPANATLATATPAPAAETAPATKPALLQKPALQLRGGFTSSSKSSQQTSGSYDLSVSLEIEHIGSSPGLEKLFNVLDSAIADMQK
ncbi:MAG: DUF2589 domain-containing protein [Minicystis sp.]